MLVLFLVKYQTLWEDEVLKLNLMCMVSNVVMVMSTYRASNTFNEIWIHRSILVSVDSRFLSTVIDLVQAV